MKSVTRNLTAATAAVITLLSSALESKATNVTLDGAGSYKLGTKVSYSGGGKKQSGRYGNFGADYYHKATIKMDWITNHSSNRSGDLSFEFWGMPFYGATKGIVLMTQSLDSLGSGNYYRTKSRKGYALYLDEYRFPELNLWEYTRSGWKFRDALSFRQNNLL